ncbi:MAG TPA: hypothetical protein VG248_02835 [Caulobacteraceae bacterium]|jgi:hypothetical protein|nr:hypothetical protein [Caulobacteraceae bacterium]
MATTYKTAQVANSTPAIGGHGIVNPTARLHAVSGSISTWVINDTVQMGYLPKNAVVVGCGLKASAQLDSSGSATLTFDVGIVGTLQLFKAAVSTVGRAAGVSADTTIAAGGYLYKTTADTLIVVTAHAAAATPGAGTLELELSYFVEDTAGSVA